MNTQEAVIVSTARTPIGRAYRGAFNDTEAPVLSAHVVDAALARAGIDPAQVDDVYLGNGASELIVMALNALLDNGDEVLLPAPDYPLWTAAASLSGGVRSG